VEANDRLLADLTPAQRHAVVVEAQPLAILAGAGSGKTRVLTRRIAHRVATGSAEAQHVLALTFTRRAAGELSSRLGALGVRDRVAAGTFHAIAYAQLRARWTDRGERSPTLLQHKARLVGPLLPSQSQDGLREVIAEIEWAKARLVAPGDYEAAVAGSSRRAPVPAAAVASIYERYEHEKRRRALVDFDDLVLLCAAALDDDPQFAVTQRWRFRHLFVDEFQDMNPAQFRVLEGWRGERPDLCVVGDPNQAIYSWNGADPRFLTDFGRRFPGATVVHLDDNFRSSPQVVTVARAVLGDRAGGHLRSTAPDGPLPTVTAFANDRDEAEGLARALRRAHAPGRPWSHLAVLTRTHAQLVLIEEALRASAIPYRLRGSAAFLDRPEIREALSDLRRRPPGTPLATAVADLTEVARSIPAATSDNDGDERRQHLDTLVRLAIDQLALDPTAGLDGFLAWLVATLRADDHSGPGDAVELATFHAAKGLEWPVVFLAGLEQGLVPIGHAESPESRAEERRLFYVAVTRAERELHCSWAERRTYGGRALGRTPSPYLAAVEAAVQALADGSSDTDWRRHLDDSRAQIGPPAVLPTGDPVMVSALRSWRASTARAAGVPAYVILHDSTIAAMAVARPADRASLLAVPGMGPVKAERYGDALLELVTSGH
jgi:DNA helicase-2/ATP-dependent DNA helicase PcrA